MSLWHGRWKEKNCKFLSKYCTFDENKLFIRVKSIERWVLDALRREKKMEKVFHCNDIAQRKSEICCISRRGIFSIKWRKKIHLPWQLWGKIIVSFDLKFFRRPSTQLPTLDIILAECKLLSDFTVISKNKLCKWCRKLRFGITSATKKMQVH